MKRCTFANPKINSMDEILNVSFEDFIKEMPANGINVFVKKINYSQMAGRRIVLPVRFNAIMLVLCKNGELFLSVDYRKYLLKKNMMLMISNLHIIDNLVVNEHFECYAIFMSLQFAKSIVNEIQGISKLIEDDIRPIPVVELDGTEIQCLADIVERIIKIQSDTSHAFQNYIIRNEVSNLFLEILNFRIKRNKNQRTLEESKHGEEIARKFIHLLLVNSKEHHEVSFYAEKICMTAGNLSRIMKTFSGQTAIKWINEVLVTEAKILLRKPNSSVQQVANELHFGDQSSFGKFFRKHTGLTPREYRKSVLK
jgi:AraC-like DNA-binding protein